MTVIAVVAMGEMGAGFAQRLVERGARVLTSLAGRSEASAKRANAAGATVTDDATLIAEADMFLSIVPPSVAGATAERFLPFIEKAARKPVYIDCNAIAPQTLAGIAKMFGDKGLPFLDGSIIGAAPRPDGSSPRLYMSGPIKGEAEALKQLGIDTRVLSSNLGDASTLKMSYAGITKGFQALGASMALGAGRNGAQESLVGRAEVQPAAALWLAVEGDAEHVRQGLSLGWRDARDRKVPFARAGCVDHAGRRRRSLRAYRRGQPRRAKVGDHLHPRSVYRTLTRSEPSRRVARMERSAIRG